MAERNSRHMRIVEKFIELSKVCMAKFWIFLNMAFRMLAVAFGLTAFIASDKLKSYANRRISFFQLFKATMFNYLRTGLICAIVDLPD